MQQIDNNSLVKRVYTSEWDAIQLNVSKCCCVWQSQCWYFLGNECDEHKHKRNALRCSCIVFHFVIDMLMMMMMHNVIGSHWIDCQQLFSSQFILFYLFSYRLQLIQFWDARTRVRLPFIVDLLSLRTIILAVDRNQEY